jgi:hypothetical protein
MGKSTVKQQLNEKRMVPGMIKSKRWMKREMNVVESQDWECKHKKSLQQPTAHILK